MVHLLLYQNLLMKIHYVDNKIKLTVPQTNAEKKQEQYFGQNFPLGLKLNENIKAILFLYFNKL